MTAQPQGVSESSALVRSEHDRRLSALRWILAFGILSTGLHFAHNFVAIDRYPDDLVKAGA